jgi:hypothetical protein
VGLVKALQLLAGLVDERAPDEWYVTDGATAVGPVGLELLARGITAGRVPPDAFVRHASWGSWRGLADLAEQDPSFDPRRTLTPLRALKREPARQTLDSIDVLEDAYDPIEPVDETSEDAFAHAADLPEALLILMAAAVKQCEAEAALVHGALPSGSMVVCSHGPRMFEVLGDKLPAFDPVLGAAKKGLTILAEPAPGVGGSGIKARLSRLGERIQSAFMVPLLVEGRLLAFIEVGRAKPFRAHDAAEVEKLVDAVVARVERSSWSREWTPAPIRG